MKRRLHSKPSPITLDDGGTRKLGCEWFKTLISESTVTKILIGCDEVGNGAWYGPICVGAVAILNGWHIDGIKDSKKIRREKLRQQLAAEIRHNTVWVTGMIHADKLEEMGAGRAMDTLQNSVIQTLVDRVRVHYPTTPIEVILDGDGANLHKPTHSITRLAKADDLVYEVSAASILAKVTRDDWIHAEVAREPMLSRYKLDDNKGYGTDEHAAGLRQYGLTQHHRPGACRGQMKQVTHGFAAAG